MCTLCDWTSEFGYNHDIANLIGAGTGVVRLTCYLFYILHILCNFSKFKYVFQFNSLAIVGTVYHLIIYMQSNKIHIVFLMIEFIRHIC